MLDTWTPLFKSIITSSIWGQPPHVKIVWVTMLALTDKTGFVHCSVSGLARAAVVTVEECRDALEIMLGPDSDSKCSDNEGRKIARVEGGWMILNHQLYQQKMHDVSTKIGNAKRQAKFRERHKQNRPLNGEVESNRQLEAGEITQEEFDERAATSREKKA